MKNFIIRSISGIAFTAIVILAILAGPLWYALLFFIIIALMANEYLNLTIGREKTVTKALAVTSALSLFAISFLIEYSGISYRYLLLCMIPLFAIFITNLYRKEYNIHTSTQEPEKKGEARGGRVNNGYEMFPFAIAAVIYTALPFSCCKGSAAKRAYSATPIAASSPRRRSTPRNTRPCMPACIAPSTLRLRSSMNTHSPASRWNSSQNAR